MYSQSQLHISKVEEVVDVADCRSLVCGRVDEAVVDARAHAHLGGDSVTRRHTVRPTELCVLRFVVS